jgi:hypothetical protein
MSHARLTISSSSSNFQLIINNALDQYKKRTKDDLVAHPLTAQLRRDHARRLLQCLVVAIRPLGVKELAEVLAVDFDDEEGIPKLKPNWRWEDQEQAILTSCSSLITTVETDDSRVVQFSHFSVKEYLTSARLVTLGVDVSHYHIVPEPAHTILAQACMSVLLHQDDHVEQNGAGKSSPLAGYAARHWVTHAQFESMSSFLRMAMEYLFDMDKSFLRLGSNYTT